MSFPFYDRQEESAWLEDSLEQVLNDCSRMLVITGRRRIGKTSLVNHVFENGRVPYLFLFVNKGLSAEGNVRAFLEENAGMLGLKGLDAAFSTFASLFKYLLGKTETQPMVLMIDEFQNLETLEPSFFGELQKLWDRLRKKTKMLLILTGSVATAMREITENVNAPLYGRKDGQLVLRPFSTTTVKTILHDYNPDYRAEDLLTLHMITGGVAKYIEMLMQSGKTDAGGPGTRVLLHHGRGDLATHRIQGRLRSVFRNAFQDCRRQNQAKRDSFILRQSECREPTLQT